MAITLADAALAVFFDFIFGYQPGDVPQCLACQGRNFVVARPGCGLLERRNRQRDGIQALADHVSIEMFHAILDGHWPAQTWGIDLPQ